MRPVTGKAVPHSLRVVKAGFLALLLAGASGCGTRGNLETPAEAKAASNTATADSGQGKPEGAALKPHKPFVLDGLLR